MAKCGKALLRFYVLGGTLFAAYHTDPLADLKKCFDQSGYSQVSTSKAVTDLQSEARKVYCKFLESSRLAQQSRLDDYFREWELVFSKKGPFQSESRDQVLHDLMQPGKFKAQLLISDLLENRDDSEHAQEVLEKAFITSNTAELQVFLTGDEDIISGLVIASLDRNGNGVFVNMITD